MYRTKMRGREKVFHIDYDASLDDITIVPFFTKKCTVEGQPTLGKF